MHVAILMMLHRCIGDMIPHLIVASHDVNNSYHHSCVLHIVRSMFPLFAILISSFSSTILCYPLHHSFILLIIHLFSSFSGLAEGEVFDSVSFVRRRQQRSTAVRHRPTLEPASIHDHRLRPRVVSRRARRVPDVGVRERECVDDHVADQVEQSAVRASRSEQTAGKEERREKKAKTANEEE